jgi:1-acyl-sn-glycerol-3-phosphate acyltransferase
MNDVPAPGRPTLVQRIARWLLALMGWRAELAWPPAPKAIILVYPHTSNWDFVIGMLARLAWGLPASWIAKDTIFRWPLGALWRRLGGIPADRTQPHGLVEQLAAEFARRPWLWLAIAPEGTRRKTDRLKSGFWHLALAARVPVGLGYLDYSTREAGITEWIDLTGDADADLTRLRAFYADKIGRRPGNAGEIRF